MKHLLLVLTIFIIQVLVINCQNSTSDDNCMSCDLGCAFGYNAFVFENFHGPKNVQGRVMAGGNISFSSHTSIGDQLFPRAVGFTSQTWNNICMNKYGSYDDCDFCDKCGKSVLVSGDTIYTSSNSRIYFGNWLGVNLSKLVYTNPSYPEYATEIIYKSKILNATTCPNLKESLQQGLQTAKNQLFTLSQTLCNLPTTSCANFHRTNGNRGNLWINFDFNPEQEVIFIKASDLLNTDNLKITNFRKNATLIFNVIGNNVNFGTIDLSVLTGKSNHIIWNFCEATSLTVNRVAIMGTILAPKANVFGGSGQINGQLFANSFNGSTPINWFQFNKCLDLCHHDRPPAKCIERPMISSSSIIIPSIIMFLMLVFCIWL